MHLLCSAAILLATSLIASAAPTKRSSSVIFAPYLDATTDYDPTPYFKSTGTNHFTLAFVTADASGNPQWNGYKVTSKFYADKIASIRALGGDVSISFGGAAGQELADYALEHAQTAATLAATYLSVLNTYGVTWADFDIEGSSIPNTASVDLRNKAIAIMQSKQPNLKISLTLPVATTGLTYDGVNLVKNAVSNKVRVDVVNIMIMDYYQNIPYVDASGKSLMGQYGIQASQATYNQVGSMIGSIGMCPMIGINDDVKEVFTLADATQVANFAAATSYVSWVSFWVVGNDLRGNIDGKGATSGAYAKAIIAGLSGSAATTASSTATKSSTTTIQVSTSANIVSTTASTIVSGSNCFPAWKDNQNYPGGSTVSYNSVNYKSSWWQNAGVAPDSTNSYGGWVSQGACGIQQTSTTVPAKSSTTSIPVPTTTKASTTTKIPTTTSNTSTKSTASTTKASVGTSAGSPCTVYGAWACSNSLICSYGATSSLVWIQLGSIASC
ncbi:UNVERIFIED_CONTAM: hypothetical protein HDU68_012039 [Siphonaria sp. JEL0065]|nr:hypothetical protein HDU68_012039 [Siphonaria sp. JEL0065]